MASAVARPGHAAAAPHPVPWLASPAIDLLIGCGGWTIPLVGIVAVARRAGIDAAPVFYALALVCNYPHYMATIARAYGTAELRGRHRLYTLHLSALLIALAAVTPWSPWLTRAFATAYLTWSPWHYAGQNFGIALLLARRAGVTLAARERAALRAAFVASYLLWLLAVQAPVTNPDVFTLGLPASAWLPARWAALAAFVALAAVATRALLRHGWRAGGPPVLLLATQTLWFVAPTLPTRGAGGVLDPAYFSAGVLAFAHCAQYLWITTWAARRTPDARSIGAWAAVLVVGGAALFIPVPWVASRLLPLELGRCLVTVTALVNVHHFLIDGVIWKLRDTRVSHLLVEGHAVHAPARRAGRGGRRLVWGAVAAGVLGVGAVDQVQYWLTRDGASPRALHVAGRLAPHDARVLVSRARALAAGGAPLDALALLDRTLALDPLNAPALRQRGLLLLHAGRLAEAAAHYEVVERRINPDLSTLVNAGVLAARRGDLDGARARLTRALALAPDNAEAHLNLAEIAMLQHDPAEAIPHFRAYLTNAAGPPDVAEAVREKLATAERVLTRR